MKNKYCDLIEVAVLAQELYSYSDIKDLRRWANTQQSEFMGFSPIQVCIDQDRGDSLIYWLKIRLGKESGAAF